MPLSLLPSARCAAVAGLMAFVSLLPGRLWAQAEDDVPVVTRTHALINARVVQAPGRVLDRATVIIRDGLIIAVGPDAPLPFDAARIEADTLVVYAGFIDDLSHAGLPSPKEDDDRERPADPGNPPDALAGIQPHQDARALIDPGDKRLEQLRNAGFTVSHVVPQGGMLPGTGAVILLAGDDPRTLVLRGDASRFSQFETARRAYPGTDMAILARWRQLYREARRRQRLETLYAQNPTGLERPAYDPVHYAFFSVLEGRTPVFFHVENTLELHRVLTLQQQLGFPLVLTGLSGSFDAVEPLRKAGVPLLLTLDLPAEPRADAAPADSAAVPADSAAVPDSSRAAPPDQLYDKNLRTRSYEEVEAEKDNLEARQTIERDRYYWSRSARCPRRRTTTRSATWCRRCGPSRPSTPTPSSSPSPGSAA